MRSITLRMAESSENAAVARKGAVSTRPEDLEGVLSLQQSHETNFMGTVRRWARVVAPRLAATRSGGADGSTPRNQLDACPDEFGELRRAGVYWGEGGITASRSSLRVSGR